MKIDTAALSTCYGLMGRLDPGKWHVETDGNRILTVKLANLSSNEMGIQFKGSDSIRIYKLNCMGKLLGADTISAVNMTSADLMIHLKEIWGDNIAIPKFHI